jgi:ankyrin repeat protein
LHLLATCHLSNIDHGKRDLAIKLDLMRDLIKAGANPREVDYSGNTIFHDAIGNDLIPKYSLCSFNAIIAVGGVMNGRNFAGRTPLHIAASSEITGPRDPEIPIACSLDYLLQPQIKFDINALDNQGVSPLHIATQYTSAGINVWKLIQSGAKIETRTIHQETPLHYAARAGNCNNLDIIVDLYLARSLSLDSQNLKGMTALHLAAQSGRPEPVKILLHAGADPCIRDVRGRNALHFAAEFSETSEARRALRAYDEKDPLKKERPTFHHPCDKKPDAFDKMNIVISSEYTTQSVREVVRLLLAAGVDPSQLDENEHTPSDAAIMLGSVAVVDELAAVMNGLYSASDTSAISSRLRPLDRLGESLMSSTSRNFQKCLETVDFQSDTIRTLERAICCGNEVLVEEIMRIKQPRLVEADGSSALQLVTRWGLVSMMEKLIPYVGDLQSISPPLLHVALERSLPNTAMVKLLIKHGVDVNFLHHATTESPRIQGNEGLKTKTAALHILAAGHHWWYTKALRELLNAGADLEIKNHFGETALQIAISARGPSFWCDQMLDVLLEHGANVNMVASKTNLTPLNSALEAKRGPSIVKKLLNYGADGTFGPKPAIASAIDSLDYQSLEILLAAGADPNIVYKLMVLKRYDQETRFETPLQNAACAAQTHYGDIDGESFAPWLEKRGSVMTLLINHGANPYQPLKEGTSTVFHEICAVNGLVRAIIEAGTNLEMKDCEGRTPLLRSCDLTHRNRAIEGEHASLELIKGGANVHATDNSGSTALHYAIKSALRRTTKILIDHGVPPTAKDKAGLSPLYYALNPSDCCNLMHSGRKAVVALLDAGADPLEKSPDGRTALHCLAPYLMKLSSIDGRDLLNEYRRPGDPDFFAEFSKLYTRFVDAGCDREARDKNGNTPLFEYVAAEKQYSEVETPNPPDPKDMRKMFVEHDIHAVNNEGDTLLHVVARREEDYMCENDTLELFKLLVELRLDPTRENSGRVSALDIAAAYGNENILALYARNE